MFCNQCGAKLPDGVKFCTVCGAPIAGAAAPSAPVKEDNAVNYRPVAPQPTPTQTAQPAAPQQPVKAAQPQSAAPVYGAAQPQPQPQARPVAQQPAAAPVYGAAQQGAYTPPQGQSRTVPPQGQPNGYAQPGYPQPQPGYAQPQQGAYGYGSQPPYAAPPKKKSHAALIVVLAILGVIVLLAVALVVFLKLRYEEPPLPPLTEPTTVVTQAETEPEDETDATKADTTKAAETTEATTAGGIYTPLTDAQAKAAVEKTVGYWNSADQKRFIGISRMDGGIYYFTYAYWYSEVDLVGYLRVPVTGDPNGIVSIHLYYEGYESEETGYSMPAVDTDVLFDLSKAAENVIRCNISGVWEDFSYGGATMDAAMPPYESLFDVPQ